MAHEKREAILGPLTYLPTAGDRADAHEEATARGRRHETHHLEDRLEPHDRFDVDYWPVLAEIGVSRALGLPWKPSKGPRRHRTMADERTRPHWRRKPEAALLVAPNFPTHYMHVLVVGPLEDGATLRIVGSILGADAVAFPVLMKALYQPAPHVVPQEELTGYHPRVQARLDGSSHVA